MSDLILIKIWLKQVSNFLKENYELDDLDTIDYKAYRDNYLLKEDADILHDCRVLLNSTGFDASNFHQEYNYNEKSSRVKGWEYQRKNFENLINERYRIRQAKRLLRYSQLSVQQIAEDVGVFDNNYFVKFFKRSVGVTPSFYRKSYYSEEKTK